MHPLIWNIELNFASVLSNETILSQKLLFCEYPNGGRASDRILHLILYGFSFYGTSKLDLHNGMCLSAVTPAISEIYGPEIHLHEENLKGLMCRD